MTHYSQNAPSKASEKITGAILVLAVIMLVLTILAYGAEIGEEAYRGIRSIRL